MRPSGSVVSTGQPRNGHITREVKLKQNRSPLSGKARFTRVSVMRASPHGATFRFDLPGATRFPQPIPQIFRSLKEPVIFLFTPPEGSDLSDPDAASRWFVGNGSYLRRGETAIFDSLSNAYSTWTTENGEMNLRLQGQPVINAYIRQKERPTGVYVNGDEYCPIYDSDRSMIEVHLDRRESRTLKREQR